MPSRLNMMAFCPEHAKWDQNPKLTALSETTSIPSPFICGVPPPPPPPPPPPFKWGGPPPPPLERSAALRPKTRGRLEASLGIYWRQRSRSLADVFEMNEKKNITTFVYRLSHTQRLLAFKLVRSQRTLPLQDCVSPWGNANSGR